MYEILSGSISGYSTNLLAKRASYAAPANNVYLYCHISYFVKEKVAGLFFMKVGILSPEPSPGLSYSVMPIARTNISSKMSYNRRTSERGYLFDFD